MRGVDRPIFSGAIATVLTCCPPLLGKRFLRNLVVCVLLAILIIGIPLEAKLCANDCGWCDTPGVATITNANSSNSTFDDCLCCASCICCHGYASDPSGVSLTVIAPIGSLPIDAPIEILDGSHSTIEEPPRQ
jgi:hypothetical protein